MVCKTPVGAVLLVGAGAKAMLSVTYALPVLNVRTGAMQALIVRTLTLIAWACTHLHRISQQLGCSLAQHTCLDTLQQVPSRPLLLLQCSPLHCHGAHSSTSVLPPAAIV